MTEKIQTRIFVHGSEKESDWPSDYGTGESGQFYWDSETQTFKSGTPPIKIKIYGQAPYVIQDTMEAYRHPSTGETIESKSKLRDIDNVCGTITTDKYIPPDPTKRNEADRLRRKDLKESLHKAVAMVDAGTAPLTEETRALCAQQNEIVSRNLGMDAFNVAGIKNDRRGKKFRR